MLITTGDTGAVTIPVITTAGLFTGLRLETAPITGRGRVWVPQIMAITADPGPEVVTGMSQNARFPARDHRPGLLPGNLLQLQTVRLHVPGQRKGPAPKERLPRGKRSVRRHDHGPKAGRATLRRQEAVLRVLPAAAAAVQADPVVVHVRVQDNLIGHNYPI